MILPLPSSIHPVPGVPFNTCFDTSLTLVGYYFSFNCSPFLFEKRTVLQCMAYVIVFAEIVNIAHVAQRLFHSVQILQEAVGDLRQRGGSPCEIWTVFYRIVYIGRHCSFFSLFLWWDPPFFPTDMSILAFFELVVLFGNSGRPLVAWVRQQKQ